MVEDIAGPDNLKKFNDILQDETPRKAPDVTSTRKDFMSNFYRMKILKLSLRWRLKA
jgi:hypothetical protein